MSDILSVIVEPVIIFQAARVGAKTGSQQWLLDLAETVAIQTAYRCELRV
jgi:hypothetical protein